ncbi:alkaline phosphatase PafA [Niabella yanshanensis]|uniref:Alkaline phosphatase PafA n=1 Tax=Niabella yanshanensis TaxID=577386 RepID=A0ABZ0W7I4_9BACT|nr:alkaline phosphatase PafA [Niabella yanshanensis]WQD39248.1 alkaline phosphatase PafA [Niabella yanshanensis]
MKLKFCLGFAILLSAAHLKGQSNIKANTRAQPKIIVGMMVDQMRWDYLYKFRDRYTDGGFKRLLRDGFSCENTHIDYSPTITACGHTSVYTGSVPAIHGIIGNSWYDKSLGRNVGCVDDKEVQLVGTLRSAEGQSPRQNLATTITDQLRIATNFKSRTVGVAIKDRASILPAGHTATGAFWYEGDEGRFVTSTFYMDKLPDWAVKFNQQKIVDRYYKNNWNTLYPISTYALSTADDKGYEGTANGEAKPVFPHQLTQFAGKNYNAVKTTPYGNTLTFEFAKAAIEGYNLGGETVTDFLAVSFSSPDAIGHTYGPNSIEMEDNYLRLDKELASFFKYLDDKFGKGNYLYFITADHGVAESPGFYMENRMPSGAVSDKEVYKLVTTALQEKFDVKDAVLAISNSQIYINWDAFKSKSFERKSITDVIVSALRPIRGIARVQPSDDLSGASLPGLPKTMLINGFNARRSGDYMIILQPTWVMGGVKGATHGTWYTYDTHIPLVWMGWSIKPGFTNRKTGMTAIAPTIAALLHIQAPSGCIGEAITEVTDR